MVRHSINSYLLLAGLVCMPMASLGGSLDVVSVADKPPGAASEKGLAHVLLISSGSGGIYHDFVQAFDTRLKQLSLKNQITIGKQLLNKPLDLSATATSDPALIIAIGTKACDVISNQTDIAPVLCALVPKLAFSNLVQKNHLQMALAHGQLSVIYLDQPLLRQLNLIKLVLPQVQTVGVMLGPVIAPIRTQLEQAARAAGLNLVIATLVSQQTNSQSALLGILSGTPTSQALLALPSPAVYNRFTIRPLLLTTFHQRIPVFGYSQTFVGAGAVAGVYSTSEQLAWQAAEITTSFLQHKSTAMQLPKPVYPAHFTVSINAQISQILKLSPPAAAALELRLQALEDG